MLIAISKKVSKVVLIQMPPLQRRFETDTLTKKENREEVGSRGRDKGKELVGDEREENEELEKMKLRIK